MEFVLAKKTKEECALSRFHMKIIINLVSDQHMIQTIPKFFLRAFCARADACA
jgi:hypothetical protein